MHTIGLILLTAATASGQFGGAHAGGMHFLRRHVEASGPAPPGGPINMAGASGPASGPQATAGRRFPNVRSQVYFVDPPGMKIGWQTAAGAGGERVYLPAQLTAPARYNFTQGYIYRLKLTDIPGRPGLTLYPTIEVAPSTPATDAYLTHNPIPAIFTEEDFDQVNAGNFVTKVIYLPDPKYQELAISGVETLVSTKLEPGVDPILEADRRGTILMIVRHGAIDLEMPTSVGATTVVPGVGSTTTTAPTLVPSTAPTLLPSTNAAPGGAPFTPPPSTGNVPLDNTAPVSPAPTTTTPAAPAPGNPPATNPPAPATGDLPADPPKPADQPAPTPNPAGDKPAEAPKAGDTAGNIPMPEPPALPGQ